MTASSKITLETKNHILLIGLNRPEKYNAADLELLHALSQAYGELERNPNLWVGLVYAHGENFTAGLDLNDLGPKLLTGTINLVPEGGLDPWGMTTKQVSKPIVMAVKGICYTLGVELALASEVVVAASNARFAQLEVTRGIIPFGGGSTRLPRAAGHQRAMRYLLTGDEFDAAEALAMNVVTEVVEPGEEFNRALELAKKIANQAPLAVQATLASARSPDSEAEKRQVFERLAGLMKTGDVQRGMQAFATKEKAVFEGN